jgi:protein required for attachment to host cells
MPSDAAPAAWRRLTMKGRQMPSLRIGRNNWIIACDGAKALFLRNDGDADLLNLAVVAVMEKHQPKSSDLGTDRPGRVHESRGARRGAVEIADLHTDGERRFLNEVAAAIDKSVREHAVKRLFVVAPPTALGILRAAFSPAVAAVVTGEIAKDLVRLSTDQIERHLAA